MDKKILGNFIIYFPPIAYIIYTLATKGDETGINWTQVVITGIIALVSNSIGRRIKNQGEVE